MLEYTLNNGVKIPSLGIGPGGVGYSPKYKIENTNSFLIFCNKAYNKFIHRPKITHDYVCAISNAFDIGYRLLDYSSSYGDGTLIGEAIKKSGINRKELFLTTRISNQSQWKGNIRECLFQQLKGMNTDYIDLLMFHWPVTGVYLDTWSEMVKLYKEGYCRALGVANCHAHHLQELLKTEDFIPQINQIEVHPLFTQKPLITFCRELGIQVEGYTAVARMDDRLVRLPLLKSIAQKHSKSIVQIILRWHIQNGIIPVIRSLNKKRQKENLSIFDFELTAEEINAIDNININSRLRYDPDNCDFSIL